MTMELRFVRHRVVGSMPVAAGRAVRDDLDNVFVVERIRQPRHEIRVLAKRTAFPSLRPTALGGTIVGFHDRVRRQWHYAPEWERAVSMAPPGFALSLSDSPGGLLSPWGAAWLSTMEFAAPLPADMDAETWLRDVDLVLFQSVYAGRVVRRFSRTGVYVTPTDTPQ
jgi:hypothetical protein